MTHRSDNILLDAALGAHVGDAGLAREMDSTIAQTVAMGTMGKKYWFYECVRHIAFVP